MTLELPQRAAKHFIDEVLLPSFSPLDAVGFDPNTQPGDDAFLPVATSLSNVGAGYPSLVVQFSNETSGGESTYDFQTENGPGQRRQGTLVAIARAEAERDYRGSQAFTSLPARDVVVELIEEVERVAQANATGGPSSDFQTIGSQRAAEAPDDTDVAPPVRLANCTISYSYLRRP